MIEVRDILWAILLGLCGLGSACAPPPDSPPDYAAVFSRDRVQQWELLVAGQGWLSLLTQPELYVPADLWIDGEIVEEVGLRVMGDPLDAKPSLRIRFNAFRTGRTHRGLKRINLRSTEDDPSQVREVVASELLRAAGLAAPRAALVEVWLDGRGPGLYSLVEQVDRRFLEDRLGENDGPLIKLEPGGSLLDEGDELNAAAYEFKSDDVEPDPEDLLSFIQVLNRTADEDLERVLPAWQELDVCLSLWAALAWLVQLDSYLGTGDNLYMYRNEARRYLPIPWDLHRAFANYHGPSCALSTDAMLQHDPLSPTCGGRRPWVDRLLGVPAWRQRYLDALRDLVDGPFSPERVDEVLERWHGLARTAAHRDALSEFGPDEFDAAIEQDTPVGDNPRRVPGLKPFVRQRDAFIRRILDQEAPAIRAR